MVHVLSDDSLSSGSCCWAPQHARVERAWSRASSGGPTGGAGGRAPSAHCGHVGRPGHSAELQLDAHSQLRGPGVVRGCGRQKTVAFINLAAYYLAGIPAAFVFAFVRRLGGMGLWFGILCGLVVQMLSLLSITLCTNWNKEALKAKNRVFSDALPVDMET
ncbi:unnamed protein product [Miscanthus lutarioriparius]|uniref:Protein DETOXIFICATION n=1 Tax=Miscanthus lutarioriparius TaxID=422564 RepID=A0A811PX99_9POAL|nr:unnamed protein product [Miscanthus lutarioriparius]